MSQGAFARAHGRLQTFYADLVAADLPAGVVGYAWGDSYRGPAAQQAEYDSGDSDALYGQSPHNYLPAMAWDVWPIVLDRPGYVGTEAVSTVVGDYSVIGQLANAHGLQTGAAFEDWGHVQIPGWHQLVGEPPEAFGLGPEFDPEGSPGAALAGAGTLLLLGGAALLLRGRR